jgi:3'-phosphoadenosine 5'-phosphosulfate (PAPS) 3'-phosphatase
MAIDYLEAAVEIAREAGAVLREEAQRPVDISYKGDYDLVTQADKRSEAVIVSRLQKYFPGHAVAAEEGTAAVGRHLQSDLRRVVFGGPGRRRVFQREEDAVLKDTGAAGQFAVHGLSES